MKNKIEVIDSQIKTVQSAIENNSQILSKLMEFQISLETQLQEIIKKNESPTLAIKSASKIDFIPIPEIIYCKADLSYTEVISENHNRLIATKPITDFEGTLIKYNFYRINKSTIVNVKHIHSYDKKSRQIVMKNKDLLEVARRRRTDFLSIVAPY